MEITGKNLRFNKLSAGDFHLYSRLVMNEDVMKYITGKALTLSEAGKRFQKAVQMTENEPVAGFFIVSTNSNSGFIGIGKLVQVTDNQYEIGYMLMPEYWGKGLASEIVHFLVDFAKAAHLADELIGIVDPENPASIRVLTKFGFVLYETDLIDGLPAAYYKLVLKPAN